MIGSLPFAPKPRPCRSCEKPFVPGRAMQAVCSLRCAVRDGKQQKAEERAQTRTRKEAAKTIPVLIAEAQKAFNAYIRERDKGKPCICCGRPLGAADIGGGFDCGHYRSVGSAAHLRFNEDNAHGQTKACNRYGAGRAVDYRIGLVARIGIERVEALECNNVPHKWDRGELIEIAKTYRAKARLLQKERQAA